MFSYLLLSLILHFATAGDVISVTDNNWKKEVVDSNLPVFVKFYAPWCGHCKSLAPVWEKIAENLKGLVKVVHVDCTVDQGLCGRFGVKGYPTLKLFKDHGKSIDYQQGRDAASLVKFATSHIPNHVVAIQDDASLKTFLAKSENLPHVLLVSQKKEVPALFKALSAVFQGQLVLGQVASSVTSVVSQYGPFESFPKIVVIQPSGEKQVYDGAISVSALQQFLSQFVAAKPAGESEAPPKPAAPKPKAEPAKWTKVTAENADAECGKLCVLAFVTESEGVPEATHQQVLDSVIHKFKSDKKFKFVFAALDDQALTSKFKVGSDAALLVYNPKRERYAKATQFTLDVITQLLERVLGGDATYEKI